jgi:hypothetical protein
MVQSRCSHGTVTVTAQSRRRHGTVTRNQGIVTAQSRRSDAPTDGVISIQTRYSLTTVTMQPRRWRSRDAVTAKP